mmetsp:Transcript_27659/g.80854  ORF Transcript_27659/g.80854 Transcript_27659/m.80854 type:complete len:218 (+) Transcript_27659:911-1564(+)
MGRCGRPGLCHVHLGVHGKTQGHLAHHGGVHGRCRDVIQAHLCSGHFYGLQRRLLLYRRFWLDRRALLLVLRAALGRRQAGHLRRHSRPPHTCPGLEHRGQILREPLVHISYSTEGAHGKWGPPHHAGLPSLAQTARRRRRAYKPKSVALVLQRRRRRSVPHRGQLLANRVRVANYLSTSHRRVGSQAGIGYAALLWGQCRAAGRVGPRDRRRGRGM